MNQKTQTTILAVLAIIAIVLGAFAATMELLPQNNNTSATLAPEHSLDKPNISRAAADLPGPILRPSAANVSVTLVTKELYSEIEPGASYQFWTFNGTVPGPMIRVRQDDNVTVNLINPSNSSMAHSIDLHAVIGPGGGMVYSQTNPGTSSKFTFRALRPGLYVYHCATAPVDEHIANGMYGMILVEPPGGLPHVDKEFYFMQGDFYTSGAKGMAGHHAFNAAKMAAEQPDYVVFDGHVGSLTGANALTAQVSQTIRIFFGVGGPNLVSSFHVIGEIFDKVYPEASLQQSTVLTNVQTTLVPPGGATIVEFTPLVAGSYTIVDHSIARVFKKGAAGTLNVTGTSVPGIFGQ